MVTTEKVIKPKLFSWPVSNIDLFTISTLLSIIIGKNGDFVPWDYEPILIKFLLGFEIIFSIYFCELLKEKNLKGKNSKLSQKFFGIGS
jgi:hypothetical protein